MAYQYQLVSVNKPTAVKKAQSAFNKAKKALTKADKKKSQANSTVKKLSKTPKNESAGAKAKRFKKLEKAKKSQKAAKSSYDRKKSTYKKAKGKFDKLDKQKKYENKIASKLEAHDSKWSNEGKFAIYPTNVAKYGSKIIYILPSDNESESDTTNVTSYPVDKDTPRSSYARMTGRTITIEGILTGKDGDNAHDKYVTLRKWSQNHIELTYRGDIYYTHLVLSSLGRDFTDLKDNLHVTMTFSYVQAAKVETSSKKKSAKSSKTKAGNRSKKYTAITIKSGDTLWALSKKYGKSVKWIAKVNNIKNPNKIVAGRKLRVK